MEQVLSLRVFRLNYMIIRVLREKGKYEHEFLFVHSILHSVHKIIAVIKHEVSEALLSTADRHLKHRHSFDIIFGDKSASSLRFLGRVAELVELVAKRIIASSELVSKHASAIVSGSCCSGVVNLHTKCILLIEDILLILIVFILTFLIFVFLLIILITISNILMSHSEHILVLLLSVLSELLLFAVIFFIITVHLLVLIDSSL